MCWVSLKQTNHQTLDHKFTRPLLSYTEFQFDMLEPSEGKEGDMITAVLRLSTGYGNKKAFHQRCMPLARRAVID